MPKYIFITGGVVSSLGKGIAAASLALLLRERGYQVSMLKLDPYINVDPGTMNPYQHGEVFVTEDGAETDLDLGHYERFVGCKTSKLSNFTTGRVYQQVIQQERAGAYRGGTVQVIPHITDEIQRLIERGVQGADIVLAEIGGTVGDIESLPFLESIRQLGLREGRKNSLFIHLTLIPYIETAGEFKTKPTQHSVKELRSIGIQPDILLGRSKYPLQQEQRQKIALFANVAEEAVVSAIDTDCIYDIPHLYCEQGLDKLVLDHFELDQGDEPDLSRWHKLVTKIRKPRHQMTLGLVGKYTELTESYKSLNEALIHAGAHADTRPHIRYIDSETLESGNLDALHQVDAVLVPGGFGKRGVEGKICAIQYARENNVPYLGICLGMQLAVIEYARHFVGLEGANSTEFCTDTPHPVVALVTEWQRNGGGVEQRSDRSQLGGTMRLGGYRCHLVDGTKTAAMYQSDTIVERHRHRYEINSTYLARLGGGDLCFSAMSEDRELVEMIELRSHPWFIGCQFHPEYLSRPLEGHPLFISLIRAALEYRAKQGSSL